MALEITAPRVVDDGHFDSSGRFRHRYGNLLSMLTVVLDSNSVHKNTWLTSGPGPELLKRAKLGSCRIVFPEVVLEELRRQQFEAAASSKEQASKALETMSTTGIDVGASSQHLETMFRQVNVDIDAAFSALLANPQVSCEPIPHISIADAVRRDLDRRRPFEEIQHNKKVKSVGFRDAVIWETVLAILADQTASDTVLFVSADKAFSDDASLSIHPHLLKDLDERGVSQSRLMSAKNPFQAIAIIDGHSAQTTAATEALYSLVRENIESQLVHGGDYDYPDFVEFTVPDFESAYINDIEQTKEFEFVSNGDKVTATGEAVIYLEGAIYKGDWYTSDHNTVRISGELNRHYLEAVSEITVRVVVEMDKSGGTPEIDAVRLQDILDTPASKF